MSFVFGKGFKTKLKSAVVKVHMLDDQEFSLTIDVKLLGRQLCQLVYDHFHIMESSYFGIEFVDRWKKQRWLEPDKPVMKQTDNFDFTFSVKFYMPDPVQLEDEYTRYLFALQIKRDLAQGVLLCSDNTAALLASYIVQAEIGDYMDDNGTDYLQNRRFFPNQTRELENRIISYHKNHVGQSARDADLNLLDIARKIELYGIHMKPAKDHEGVSLNLSVAHMGVLVFQNNTKINTFSWAKIRKICFKRKKFLIRLQPDSYGYYKDTVEFYFDTRDDCKCFWKSCIENHTFFRCSSTKQDAKRGLLTRGSSFRYNGLTLKETIENSREHFKRSKPFERIYSSQRRVAPQILPSPNRTDMIMDDSGTLYHDDSSTHGSRTLDSSRFSHDRSVSSEDFFPTSRRPSLSRSSHVDEEDINDVEGELNMHLSQLAIQEVVSETTASNDRLSVLFEKFDEKASSVQDLRDSSAVVRPSRSSSSSSKRGSAKVNVPQQFSTIPGTVRKRRNLSASYSSKDSLHSLKSVGRDKRTLTLENFVKEMILTERTYTRFLGLIAFSFSKVVSHEPEWPQALTKLVIEPLASFSQFHHNFLESLEQCWQNDNLTISSLVELIGTVLSVLRDYKTYAKNFQHVLHQYNKVLKTSKRIGSLVLEFESRKSCFICLSAILMKPLLRIFYFKSLIKRLLRQLPENVEDVKALAFIYAKIKDATDEMTFIVFKCVNMQKLIELQREIAGLNTSLLSDGDTKTFIREGCLQKISRRGYQQRMFFLFSDSLLYCARTSSSVLKFKLHGEFLLSDIQVDVKTNVHLQIPHSFILTTSHKSLYLAASSENERTKWVQDIKSAVSECETEQHMESSIHEWDTTEKTQFASGCSFADSTVRVCWHRLLSLGFQDLKKSIFDELSGFLLRKYKNSNGWQKLWVVLTNFCLFFFRTYHEEAPLATLPLLGYCISEPTKEDNISKNYVFKLQFKNHMYFFRAANQYWYERWTKTIKNVAK